MITENAVMRLVREYAKSEAGKAAIKKQYGVEYADKIDKSRLRMYGQMMKQILFRYVVDVIHSIRESDIVVEEPKLGEKGLYTLNISFKEGSLHRESLYDEGYPDGIENIVLLFTRGYHAKRYAYGVWAYRDFGSMYPVRSRKDREPNDFMKRAVEEFNKIAKGSAVAALNSIYEE